MCKSGSNTLEDLSLQRKRGLLRQLLFAVFSGDHLLCKTYTNIVIIYYSL